MSTIEIVLTIVSILLAVLSFMLGYFALRRDRDSDSKEIGRESGTVMSDLGYIKSSIERIEKRLDISDTKFDGISTRLARVEEGVSSAHKRLDEHVATKRTTRGKKDE
ncbi:MAG: hypothetical protein FWE36_00130 [Erysipelotrichales bacterium]|nr:hypothetical protein [Erysipelotrichales bacterium]